MWRGACHPKMAALVAALLRHFGGGGDGPEGSGSGEGGVEGRVGSDMGRAIVFTNLRESVAAIVETLAPHAPLIKPRCPAVFRTCDPGPTLTLTPHPRTLVLTLIPTVKFILAQWRCQTVTDGRL